MSKESRVKKSLQNMKVNLVAYFVTIVVSFFTRKIFLDQLGDEFIGLTTAINSLLAFLNLAELGVGASIAYFLYKPLYDDDKGKINEIISIMGYLYRFIGLFILCAGIVLSFFLPLIFEGTQLSWFIVYYCFYGQLVCSLIGYFFNYKANTIFNADQRQYLVNGYFQLTQIVCTIIQMLFALYTNSCAIYITVSIVFAVVNSIILNWKFNKVYPWVEASYALGRKAIKYHSEIIQYVKRVFVHQIGGFINNSVMPLIVYAYASLTMVTFYGNYVLINSKISQLVNAAFSGTNAGIGNLIAEGNTKRIYDCYKELFSIKFFAVMYLSICLVRLNSDFVAVWLGEKYVLEFLIVALICADFCLNLLRDTTEQYLNGFGLKADVWVPLCRIASLALVIVAGKVWGLAGLLAVPVVVQLLLMHIWKPFYLYRDGFKRRFSDYMKLISVNLLPFVCAYFVAEGMLILMDISEGLTLTWRDFLVKSLVFSLVLGVFSVGLAYFMSEGIRSFVKRMREGFLHKN